MGESNIKVIDATNLNINDIAALQNNTSTAKNNYSTNSINTNNPVSSILTSSISDSNLQSNSSLTKKTAENNNNNNNSLSTQITANNHIIIYDNSNKIEAPPRISPLKKIGNLAASETIGSFGSLTDMIVCNQNGQKISDDRAREIAQQVVARVEAETFLDSNSNSITSNVQNVPISHIRHINIDP